MQRPDGATAVNAYRQFGCRFDRWLCYNTLCLMATWRDQKMMELAGQLTYSPAEKRHEQLQSALELLPTVEAGRDYPWEFVLFRITGFRPVHPTDHSLAGKTLRHDLATLIEFLSDTLAIQVENAGGAVLTLEEVTKKFDVSSKTIQRWRKAGLIAMRYIYPDGRRRLGFLESSVAQFASANKERVEKSATFRQLSEDERELIIKWARRLSLKCQCCIKEISERIGKKLNRAPETIRYTIRKHDKENPETAIFPEHTDPIRELDRQVIIACFDRGVPIDCLAQRYCRTKTSIYRVVTSERAANLKRLPIEVTPNALFDHPDADNIILKELPAQALAAAQESVAAGQNAKAKDLFVARVPRDLPGYLQDIFKQPVMPQEIELDAFRRMNYLKHKALKLIQSLDVAAAKEADLAPIEALLLQANAIKNQLVQSNLRVAVHVARKHQRPDRQLMELVSDGTIWLMRAVEKFDFTRNVKFSTYASYAIMKNFARDRAEALTRRDKHLVTGQDEVLNATPERVHDMVGERLDEVSLKQELTEAISELSTRERELLTAHYGLNEEQESMSLSELGEKLGLTKARVRQLEMRALKKLRTILEDRKQAARRGASAPDAPPAHPMEVPPQVVKVEPRAAAVESPVQADAQMPGPV